MSKTIEEVLSPKPEARPRLYAYSIADKAHAGLLKVGQTTREVAAGICACRRAVASLPGGKKRTHSWRRRSFKRPTENHTLSGRQDAALYGRQGCLPPLFQTGGKG